ncbi:MAG: C4-type zinc ribbon domain-containing protein [candidate division WOR-3 bacterium]|nr:C4-type zinc ribbon domain-containing protein [candidate division WOR-3 bacterium]MCX7756920.1 C4-type zinc ribbon domain-containing protein [candidate division WOR-3 bacterium]MDW7987652.1 C4-type zinc ribbon domain-containing protein [candidate division WOR-3 bacterium]
MREVLEKLAKLQRLDNELKILQDKSNDIPKRIEGLKLTVDNKKQEIKECQEKILNLKKENKLLEVELKSVEDKIVQYSAQLYSAKTNEQYKAFLKEIDAQKKEKTRIEDKIIEVLENLELTEKKLKELESELKDTEVIAAENLKKLEKEDAEVKKAIKEREEIRQELIKELTAETVAIYERIRKSKNGVAVVIVNDERCQGCFNPLPAQKILEIKKNDRIHFCEYCGRIVISKEINSTLA